MPERTDLSAADIGKLEAEHPYPKESRFRDASALTFQLLRDFDKNKISHLEEIRGRMQYKDISTLPPWGSGTPLRMIDKLRKHKQEQRLSRRANLSSMQSKTPVGAKNNGANETTERDCESATVPVSHTVSPVKHKLSIEEAVGSPIARLSKLQHEREILHLAKNMELASLQEAKKRGASKAQGKGLPALRGISWRQTEPAIFLKTKNLMANFQTKDTTRILMGIKID